MLEQFYKENYRIVYGYLLALCGDTGLAEELTAEVFLRAVEKISTYDPKYRPATWLCTIGRNLYIDEHRRRSRFAPLDDTQESPLLSPEILCIQQDEARRIMEAAKQLPPQQRQVLFMRLEGMAFRPIGKTENWARVTFFRAKNEILKRLEESE